MLAIQDYLRGQGDCSTLKADLGVNSYRHPTLPLVGFKYSQVESPKTHPVVRDARGIVLEDGTWNVVAKPFRRFFNAGEDAENFARFNWGDFTATTKEDGSLILLYFYAGEWHVNTSGSFGIGTCGDSGKSWRELFWATSGIDRSRLCERLTYVFEMWTPHNKVIRYYPGPTVFLLSVFHNGDCSEATVAGADELAKWIGVPRPDHHRFGSMDDIAEFLKEKEASDKTFEGIVIRDNADERYKIKSATYLSLHHLLDNGNLLNPKRLVPLVLAGETEEVLAYLPEIKSTVDAVRAEMDRELDGLLSLWRDTWQIESQKDFAVSIVKRTRFASLLFNARKHHGANQTEDTIRDQWRESGDLIAKVLYC